MQKFSCKLIDGTSPFVETVDGKTVKKPMTLAEFRLLWETEKETAKTKNLKTQDNAKYPTADYINQCIARVRRVFKWGAKRKKVKSETYYDLKLLEGLKGGRSKVRKSQKINVVADWIIRLVRKHEVSKNSKIGIV